jgi:predicted porin
MKRNLIALAVAGAFLAPAAAMADGSGIVLTGVVHGDIGFGSQKRDNGDKVYKNQANIGTFATRWEIDGTEDLGWAQAIFGLAMDQQFAGSHRGGNNLVTNNNNVGDLNNRNSFLGLTGGFGTVKIGQNEHLYEIQQILQDPDPASENTFSTLTLMTSWGGYHNGFTRRDSQSIWYASPNIGGATIEAAYITPAGGKTDSLSPYGVQIGANWKSTFGLSLYGAYAQYNDEGEKSKNKALRLGVGYGMELFQVDLFGEQLKYTNDSGLSDKRVNIGVSGAVNFGQHHIRAAISSGGKVKRNGSSISDSNGRLLLVGYAYTLSKRTELQVNYGMLDNKKQSGFGTADVNDETDGGFGNDAKRFGVGIRHTF